MDTIFLILIFAVLSLISDRIWRLVDATKKHNAKAAALLTEIRDSLHNAR